MRQPVGGDAAPRVGHRDSDAALSPRLQGLGDPNDDGALRRRESDGIAHEVRNDLCEPPRICEHDNGSGRRVESQRDAALLRLGCKRDNDAAQDRRDVARPRLDRQQAQIQLGEVVEVADHATHSVRGARDGFDHAAGGTVVAGHRFLEETSPHDNRGERIFQIVANDRDEILVGLTTFETDDGLVEIPSELSRDGPLTDLDVFGSRDSRLRLTEGGEERTDHSKLLIAKGGESYMTGRRSSGPWRAVAQRE